MKISQFSEDSLFILFEQRFDQQQLVDIKGYQSSIQQQLGDVVVDLVPAAASIYLSFDVLAISANDLIQQLQAILSVPSTVTATPSVATRYEIPVYYGQDVAWDIEVIASHAQLSVADVVRLHCQKTYHIYAVGFAPGFAYLGEVDSRIALPRLATPRTQVPRGSVAIADRQTAVYPAASPGGWNIIGRTPAMLFDSTHGQLPVWSVGDEVRFSEISRDEFLQLGGQL